MRDNPFLEERRAPFYGSRAALVAAALSLPEHLAEQLRIGTDDPAVLAIGGFFIGNLDEDGYLQLGMGEAAELAEVAVQRVDEVLKLIKGLAALRHLRPRACTLQHFL